jgi:hypothetical protein
MSLIFEIVFPLITSRRDRVAASNIWIVCPNHPALARYLNTRIQVLVLRANDLLFSAKDL